MNAPTPTVLERILQSTRAEIERRKLALTPSELEARASGTGRPHGAAGARLGAALRKPGIGVIAEFKRASPSLGALRKDASVVELVSAYERGGASALSVLTEGPNFDGSLEDLSAASAACDLPVLRKDFIVDAYQLHEARLAGADAVLLIVAALERKELESLYRAARALGLDVLVEVHDRQELETALEVEAEIVGINNRDLRDFSVDVERTSRLLDDVPAGVIVVSESGISSAGQLQQLEQAGVHAVLVGELLMRSADPEAALRALRGEERVDLDRSNILR